VELVRRLDPRLPMISADATQLEQAFLNLTLNAVEAMPKGGRLTIRTRTLPIARPGQRPTHVMVRFRDTGEGMSEEQRKRAFSSLLQTTKPKGTGLGLAIVARVVDQHQGLVKVWSQLAKGTTISVVLPVGA
jgi:signal transduction histidine kinase